MGYIGKYQEKLLAQKLRAKGWSYKQILNRIPVSKSTISLWCRGVVLTSGQMEKLLGRRLQGSEKGRILGAKKQQNARMERIKVLMKLGRKEVGRLAKRDRFIAGISLYAGEGDKGDKIVGFSNSNPRIIAFMMKWFREFCDVAEEKFRGAIWIHDNLDAALAKNYWSKLTGIPVMQFYKTYIAENKVNSRKVRKQLHEHGVFAIRIADVGLQRRILGWMVGILK